MDYPINNHFSKQEVTDMMGKTLTLVNATAQSVNVLTGKVGDLSKKLDELETVVGGNFKKIGTEIENLKNNTEVETRQKKQIRRAVTNRVCELLGLPQKKTKWNMEQKLTYEKYGNLFHRRCYSEVSKMGHLASPYEETIKKYYTDAIKDIESWIPLNGISGLKREADENAIVRRTAREQGY